MVTKFVEEGANIEDSEHKLEHTEIRSKNNHFRIKWRILKT